MRIDRADGGLQLEEVAVTEPRQRATVGKRDLTNCGVVGAYNRRCAAVMRSQYAVRVVMTAAGQSLQIR
jgi:hypothetical protein